jgi:energy-converting hydrogenase Eha subunit A
MTETNSLLVWVLVGVVILAVLVIVAIVIRGRRIPGEHVFRTSRWSRGNHLFPTQVAITPDSVVHFTPEWFGRREQSIHMAHVSSVEVDTNLFFSNVVIETSGGSEPVRCHGHRKRDAVEMKRLINKYQSDYYGPNRHATHV